MVPSTADPRGREPLAVKVPEITALFWVIKLLTTAGGEAISDYLALDGHVTAGVIEMLIFVVAVWCQFRTRRYVAAAYWFLALAIAIFGTGIADAMHLIIGIPYGGTTVMWAVALALIFWQWYRSEGTLSIHSITTRRREMFYWATVFATFALGTALGDFTASVLHLGYFGSAVLFAVVIMIPLIAWRSYGMNSVLAFWFAYVITRPLGASIADWLGKPRSLSGLNYGEASVAGAFLIGVVALVSYLTVTKSDVQLEEDDVGLAGYQPVPQLATADGNGYPTAQYGFATADYGKAAAYGYAARDEYGYRAVGDYRYHAGDAPTQRYSYRPREDEGYQGSGRGRRASDVGWERRAADSGRADRSDGNGREDDLADYGGGWRPARSDGARGQRPGGSGSWASYGDDRGSDGGRPDARPGYRSGRPDRDGGKRGYRASGHGYERSDRGLRPDDYGYDGDDYR